MLSHCSRYYVVFFVASDATNIKSTIKDGICANCKICANFSLLRPLFSRLRPNVRDRQIDVRRQTSDVRRQTCINTTTHKKT